MIVCACYGVSEREVRRAVREGAISRRQVQRASGAGSGCGGCIATVDQILEEMASSAPPAEDPNTLLSPPHELASS